LDGGTPGALQWASNFGVTGGLSPTAVAIAPSTGAVVAVGGITGSVNFGGGLLTSTAGYDTFIAQVDSSGGYKWAKMFGNGMLVGANSVAVDSSGNVAVAGVFQGSVSFGGPMLTAIGKEDVFVVEYDPNGTYLWGKNFGAAGEDQGLDTVAVDPSGNVLIAGEGASMNLGGGALTGFFIGKFTSAGTYSWSKAFATPHSTESTPKLAVDRSGNVILAGSFVTTVNFGGGILTSAGSFDVFVAKFDSSGVYQWGKQYGDSGAAANAVATDACGNIFVTGAFGGSINFGTGTLTADPTVENIFLAKIDASGKGVWADPFAGSGVYTFGSGPGSVAVGSAGDPVLICPLTGSVNLGGGVLSSVGETSPIIAGFSPTGSYRWAYTGGATSTAVASGAQGVATSAGGAVVVGTFGAAGKTLALAGKTLTAVSDNDLFVASFAR
jgi:hypothetical protein